MSSTLVVRMIDLDELQDIPGSANRRLLEDLLSRGSERMTQHDAWFAGSILGNEGGTYTPIAQALGQIVSGEIDLQLRPRFQFEHAVALIVDLLGDPLPAHAFEEVSPALHDEVDAVIARVTRRVGLPAGRWPALAALLRRGPLLDVPLDVQWPLGCGFLHLEEAMLASPVASALQAGDADDLGLRWPDDALEAAHQYGEWLQQATLQRMGLFLHF